MPECEKCFFYFEEIEGEKGYRVICGKGYEGGCAAPTRKELDDLDKEVGTAVGALRPAPPIMRDEFGRPVTNRW